MQFFKPMASVCAIVGLPFTAVAQTSDQSQTGMRIELNVTNDTGTACRMTFVAENATGQDITQAVYETVIFDTAGSVVSLTLFDFRDLPADRPRVRQFDVSGITCDAVGKVLINGASTCKSADGESTACDATLSLTSRMAVELLG